MQDTGAGSDNGVIDNDVEANLIPCESLQDIQQRWQSATNGRCGLYGVDGPISESPQCQKELNRQTLTFKLFPQASHWLIAERLKICLGK